MFEYNGKLDKSIISVRDNCSEDEFHSYRYAVAHIMADMLLEILNPIFDEHPDLEPDELRASRGK